MPMQFYMRWDSSIEEKLHFSRISTVKKTSQTSHPAVSATQTGMKHNCIFYYTCSAYTWTYHAFNLVHPIKCNVRLLFAVVCVYVCMFVYAEILKGSNEKG